MKDTDSMLVDAMLPKWLQPVSFDNLVRFGRDYDGGYLVNPDDVQDAELLLSLGISDDWSFEKHFYDTNPVPIMAFDRSVSKRRFSNLFIKAAKDFRLPYRGVAAYKTLQAYKQFFQDDRKHIEKFVGLDNPPSEVTLATVLSMPDIQAAKHMFLKIDIEGSEYRLLDDLVTCADRTTGLAIEFHDVDLHMPAIKNFIERYPLNLIHLHGNNCSPLGPQNCPLVIEATFTRAQVQDLPAQLPHSLDMPNTTTQPEYRLRFE